MWKVALRGLLAHKLRMALTALSIILGVGFVAGTYVLTDTIQRTFTDLFNQTTKGIDVAVRTKEAFSGNNGEQRAPVPASVLNTIKGVPGVAVAEGSMIGYAQFVTKDGKPVNTGGAPTIGVSIHSAPQLHTSTVREGALPSKPDDV